MKKVGFIAAAMLAVVTVACGGRDEANENPDATIGTGGEVTNDTSPTLPDTRTSSVNDVQEWAQEVAVGNMAEIELGKLASERALDAEVRKFGQMMVKDHTASGNEFKQVVGNQLQLPTQLDENHRELVTKLSGMKGMEFDREYMNAMVDGHEEMKDRLEQRANQSSTAGSSAPLETALNQWAAKTLPVVEMHLQHAQQLKEKVDSSGRNTTQNNRTTGNTRPGQ
jgi:putative membrane protein